jgi:DNA-binding NarL/FixJ family response regulator
VFDRQMSISQFLDCVEHVRNGSIWAGADETVFLLEAMKESRAINAFTDELVLALTARQLQVVRSVATGKTNKAIASELNLSEHTVKNYLFQAFGKLGVSSRVELLFYLTMRGYTFASSNDENERVFASS